MGKPCGLRSCSTATGQRAFRGTRQRKPPRGCAPGGVVGAIILLATLVGVHDLTHLQGGLDARRCVECQWSYDTGASVVTGALVLFPILALLGLCLSPKPAPAVAPSRRARPPRAPPALG